MTVEETVQHSRHDITPTPTPFQKVNGVDKSRNEPSETGMCHHRRPRGPSYASVSSQDRTRVLLLVVGLSVHLTLDVLLFIRHSHGRILVFVDFVHSLASPFSWCLDMLHSTRFLDFSTCISSPTLV